MQVTIHIIRGNRSLVTIGIIRLTNPELVAEPHHSKLLQEIIQTPIHVTVEGQPRELRSDIEPELFLKHLHLAYTGPYVKATPAEL